MGFQDFRDFGQPRHPAIRTTGLLTLALAGLSPAEHTSVYWSQLSDMLAVRIGQLTAEVFHLLDLQPCWLLRTIAPFGSIDAPCPVTEGKPTRQDGSVSWLSVAEIVKVSLTPA